MKRKTIKKTQHLNCAVKFTVRGIISRIQQEQALVVYGLREARHGAPRLCLDRLRDQGSELKTP
jgi:hypothetical protein